MLRFISFLLAIIYFLSATLALEIRDEIHLSNIFSVELI